jgi:hypothetical protein
MANRPAHYYALLEFFISVVAVAGGLIAAAISGFEVWRTRE